MFAWLWTRKRTQTRFIRALTTSLFARHDVGDQDPNSSPTGTGCEGRLERLEAKPVGPPWPNRKEISWPPCAACAWPWPSWRCLLLLDLQWSLGLRSSGHSVEGIQKAELVSEYSAHRLGQGRRLCCVHAVCSMQKCCIV